LLKVAFSYIISSRIARPISFVTSRITDVTRFALKRINATIGIYLTPLQSG